KNATPEQKKKLDTLKGEADTAQGKTGLVAAAGNVAQSIPGNIGSTLWGLVPQSAKELANTDAMSQIPEQFQKLAKDKGGYMNAFVDTLKSMHESVVPGLNDFVSHVDRARQAVENHPVYETLGWLGLKELATNPAKFVKDTQ